MIEVGYLEVEEIVAAMSGVADREMIRRRFKYLQRMSYPAGTNTGRGRKTLLRLEQLLQVLLAFELMQVGANPTRSIRILRTNWSDLREALVVGWIVSRKPALLPLRIVLNMNAGAFEDAGKSEDPYEPVAQPFRPQAIADLVGGLSMDGATTRVTLDPSRLAAHLFRFAVSEKSRFDEDALDDAFFSLWEDVMPIGPDKWIREAIRSGSLGKIEQEARETLNRATRM